MYTPQLIQSAIGQTNPVLAGATSLWLLGIVTYLSRNLPRYLWMFIKARFTVSFTIELSTGTENILIAQSFFDWYYDNDYIRHSRQFILQGDVESRGYSAKPKRKKTFVSPGYGIHFFRYNGRVAWCTRSSITGNRQLEINFIGMSFDIIEQFLKEIEYKPPLNHIKIFTLSASRGSKVEWDFLNSKPKRALSSVICPAHLKGRMIEDITHFYSNKEWYQERYINHKLCYLFHGEPGTGKSSLIYALASYFMRDIYMVNINMVRESNFQSLMDSIKPGSFVVFEDIDACLSTESREELESEEGIMVDRTPNSISLSSLLNMFDGITSLEDNVIIMTTNYLTHIDSALKRRGRVDHVFEIPLMCNEQIREYIAMMYPESFVDNTIVFKPITGANIQGHFLEHKADLDHFLACLERE